MKKILVVDDDPDILEAVQLVLTTGGYDAEVTTRGDEAEQKVRDYQPDLIILDLLLSGSDGRTICRSLKRTDWTKGIPVIMISAHPSAQDSVAQCGADSFVVKPFSIDTLLTEVQKLLGGSDQDALGRTVY